MRLPHRCLHGASFHTATDRPKSDGKGGQGPQIHIQQLGANSSTAPLRQGEGMPRFQHFVKK